MWFESIHHKALPQWHWQFFLFHQRSVLSTTIIPYYHWLLFALTDRIWYTHSIIIWMYQVASYCIWNATLQSKENSSASSPPEGFRSHVSCRGQLSLSWLDATRIFNTRTVMSMTWKGSTDLILRLAVFYWTQALPWFLCQNLTHIWCEQGNYKYTHQGSLK